ncbi:MAG TPA: hypothetical protein PLN52_10185 [Opitutaceae bacterium]|nr:hypothetical protein [Opitutaceae bacterium]
MVTRPLDLLSKVKRPAVGTDWLYFVNAGLIALFFILFGSRFVISPGIVVSTEQGNREMVLPRIPESRIVGAPTTVVISVAGPDLVFTDDGKYTFAEIRRWLLERGKREPGARLLLRTEAALLLGDFTEIFSAAHQAGFVVLLAAEAESKTESPSIQKKGL